RETEYEKILLPFVNHLESSDIIIGHNILEYDNIEIAEKLKQYQIFNDYLKTYAYQHKGFFRGRIAEKMMTFYPMSFDTLLAARFLWKDESDVGYGLKNLAIKFKIARDGRVYERHFGGFGNWDNSNPLCLEYNADDIRDTFGIFKLQAKAILVNMLISGESFEDVISGSNGRMADQMSLIRSYNEEINAPMINPMKAAKGLFNHFNGELKTKKEIFEFFRTHTKCDDSCLEQEDRSQLISDEYDDDETISIFTEADWKIQENILRLVKYGEEMPDWVEYYPFLCGKFTYGGKKYIGYVSTGGKTVPPTEPMVPLHDVWKGDVAAQYPSILEAKNITANTVKLSRKGDPVDGWCWFRAINHKELLNMFEWRPASDFAFSDGEGYFIGYYVRNKVGYITRALRGIITAVGKYKKMKGWEDAYQKALKPMRNAMTHGVLLSLDSTCQQFNLAGCAIPTLGQEITTQLNSYIETNG
ncbi:MAG: 3'-5' exonuclease family protein, partial [Bacillati bacterium]